jgi:hypothetical protein
LLHYHGHRVVLGCFPNQVPYHPSEAVDC